MDSYQINNFIYSKDNAFDEELCDKLIECFEDGLDSQKLEFWQGSNQFEKGKFGRDDTQLFMPQQADWAWIDIQKCILGGLKDYASVIASVNQVPLVSTVAKLQKTPVGGGFSEWHIEQGAFTSSKRFAVWSIYLNDVSYGGETEFLYQQMKVPAQKGKLVIWPAGLTHPHRGNPPYSNEKYILTGWFEIPDFDPAMGSWNE